MSISYYDAHAKQYIETTAQLDMSHLYQRFLKYVGPTGTILDVGCGSGRDSLYFKTAGYNVVAFDGSESMVAYAKQYLGDAVFIATFESFESERLYDGVWAVASLLHVPRSDIRSILEKFCGYLKSGGIFLMSFKEREADFQADGRIFTCFNESSMRELLGSIHFIEVLEVYHTVDVRPDREKERWITGVVKRI